MKEVKACRICGKITDELCYHQPIRVGPIKMPRVAAMKLRKDFCNHHLEMIETVINKEDQTWIKDRVEKWLSELSPF